MEKHICWLTPAVNGMPLCGKGHENQAFTRETGKVNCPECIAELPAEAERYRTSGMLQMMYQIAWISPSLEIA